MKRDIGCPLATIGVCVVNALVILKTYLYTGSFLGNVPINYMRLILENFLVVIAAPFLILGLICLICPDAVFSFKNKKGHYDENHEKRIEIRKFGIELITVIALIASFYFSGSSYQLAQREFALSHRPFVYLVNYAHKNSEDKIVYDINILATRCLNAPAEITKRKFSYSVKKTDQAGNFSEIKVSEKSEDLKYIVYPDPSEKVEETYAIDFDPQLLSDSSSTILRTVRVDYKELSGDRNYFFEGLWQLDRTTNQWQLKGKRGN